MISSKSFIKILIVFLICILSPATLTYAQDQSTLLSRLSEQGKSQIVDSWEFYWQRLLAPEDELPKASTITQTGVVWNGIKFEDGSSPKTFGYATYRRILSQLPPNPAGYEIGLRGAGAAYKLFVYPAAHPERAIVVESGKVGAERSHGSRHYGIIHLRPEVTEDYVILLQVANFEYSYGGAYYPPEIGVGELISKNYRNEGIVSLLGIGIMIAVGIYSGMMWVRRRNDYPALFLAITSIAAALRILCTSPFTLLLLPNTYYHNTLRIEYVSMLLGCGSYLLFLKTSFMPDRRQRLAEVILGLDILLIAFTFVTGIDVFPGLLPLYQLFILLNAVLFAYFVAFAVRLKITGYRYVLAGCTLIILAIASDITLANISNNAFYATPLAVMVFLILQSQMVALRAAEAYSKAENLSQELTVKNKEITSKNEEITFFNKNLEALVAQKTQEIRSLLDNIPQGVCSIDGDGLLSKEYSAKLVEVIEEESIASKPFSEILLSHAIMSSDQRDQIEQSINFMLNASHLNFEINGDKLPYEIEFQTQTQKTKNLEVTWSALTDAEDNVRKILVTLHDITEQKRLAKQAEDQMQQLVIIQELLKVLPSKIRQFFATAQTLIGENESLIASRNIDLETLRILFVNAHTVKGAARSLQLKKLANDIHEAEHHYSEAIKGTNIAPEQFEADIQKINATLKEYLTTNQDVLNRGAEDTKVHIERDFILNHYNTLKDLVENNVTLDNIITTLRTHSESLTKLIFEQLDVVFEGYRSMISKIAQDLGKPAPQFEAHLPSTPVTSKVRTLLDNCMIHVLRNALDHGIESPEERTAQGKKPEGYIAVTAKIQEEKILLSIRDDGRGLALAKLRTKGIAVGVLTEKSTRDEVAALIFYSGVSTAQSVSQISGRGVGMDAVRKFLRDQGGDVTILLDAPRSNEESYANFTLVLTIPRLLEDKIQAA